MLGRRRRSSTPASSSEDNILEDSTGRINRDLAERIWNWEQERRRQNNLPKVQYSIRSGLRLLDSMVDAILHEEGSNKRQIIGTNINKNSDLYGELIQEGLFALLDAMSSYRVTEGEHEEDFETYASREIYQHLAQSLEEDTRPIRLPKGVQAVVKEANRLMEQGDGGGTKLTLAQVAAKLDMQVGRLQDYLRLAKATGHALSMESTIEILHPMLDDKSAYRDQDEWELREGMLLDDGRNQNAVRPGQNRGGEDRGVLVDEYVDESMQTEGDDEAWVVQQERIAAPLQDMIVDQEELSPDEHILEEQERSSLAAFLASTLEPQVLEVVRLYFGLDSGKALTIQETAQELGKTDEEVLDLLRQGLGHLRAAYFDSNKNNNDNGGQGLDSV